MDDGSDKRFAFLLAFSSHPKHKEAESQSDHYSIDTYRLRMSRISSFYFGCGALYRKMTVIECNATI
jgi:hypothetical protein